MPPEVDLGLYDDENEGSDWEKILSSGSRGTLVMGVSIDLAGGSRAMAIVWYSVSASYFQNVVC